jgi:ATP-dependent DNA helicase RecG
LPKPFEELKSKDISLPRNPILAKLFRMVKLAENAGFGFDKIDENWKAYNSTVPDYQIEFDSVIVDFKMEAEESAGKNVGEKSEKTSEKTSEKILSMMKDNENITIAELTEAIGVSSRSIERNIDKLKQEGKINRIGADKGGYWQIIE